MVSIAIYLHIYFCAVSLTIVDCANTFSILFSFKNTNLQWRRYPANAPDGPQRAIGSRCQKAYLRTNASREEVRAIAFHYRQFKWRSRHGNANVESPANSVRKQSSLEDSWHYFGHRGCVLLRHCLATQLQVQNIHRLMRTSSCVVCLCVS